MSDSVRKQIGVVGVDSGQVLVCDPCYIDTLWKRDQSFGPAVEPVEPKERQEFSYKGCCTQTLSPAKAGQLIFPLGHAGAGVVVTSGYGDGVYPVFAVYNKQGRVAQLVVEFS